MVLVPVPQRCFDDQKWKKFTAGKNIKFSDQKLQFNYP
jgi:hypothetical protein